MTKLNIFIEMPAAFYANTVCVYVYCVSVFTCRGRYDIEGKKKQENQMKCDKWITIQFQNICFRKKILNSS